MPAAASPLRVEGKRGQTSCSARFLCQDLSEACEVLNSFFEERIQLECMREYQNKRAAMPRRYEQFKMAINGVRFQPHSWAVFRKEECGEQQERCLTPDRTGSMNGIALTLQLPSCVSYAAHITTGRQVSSETKVVIVRPTIHAAARLLFSTAFINASKACIIVGFPNTACFVHTAPSPGNCLWWRSSVACEKT